MFDSIVSVSSPKLDAVGLQIFPFPRQHRRKQNDSRPIYSSDKHLGSEYSDLSLFKLVENRLKLMQTTSKIKMAYMSETMTLSMMNHTRTSATGNIPS